MNRELVHHTPPTFLRRVYERFGPALTVGMTFFAIAAAKSVAWLLPALALVVLLAFPKPQGLSVKRLEANALLVTCGLLALNAVLSTIWSADRSATLGAGALFSLYLGCAWIAILGIGAERDELIDGLAKAVVVAVFAGAGFLIFESLTQSLIERVLFTYVPALRPASPTDVGLLDGRVAFLALDEHNGGVAVMNVLLWPALLIGVTQSGTARGQIAVVALAAFVAVATLLSPHAASQIAIVCAAIVFLLHCLSPVVAHRLVAVGWVAAIILVLLAAHGAYRADLHLKDWLPENGRARIVIWGVTAQRYMEAPWLGIGADSTQQVTDQLRAAGNGDGKSHRGDTDAHAHNIYLQTWYELGIPGAALLLAVGLSVLRWIFAQTLLTQRFLLAAFVSAAVIGAFSWGMWRPWFMASLFFCSIIAALAAHRDRGTAAAMHSD